MGSCDNLVNVNENSSEPIPEDHLRSESLVQSVSEQYSYSEMAHADKEYESAPYVCSYMSGSNNAGNVTSNDITGSCSDTVGLVGEHDGNAALSLENSGKNECSYCGDCLNENQSEMGNVESHGDCLKGGCDGGVGGSTYLSGYCVMPSLVETMACSSSSAVQQDVQNGNDKLLVEAVTDKVEDFQDCKLSMKLVMGNSAMPVKDVTESGFPRRCDQQDELKHCESIKCILSKVVDEEKADVLAHSNTEQCEKASMLLGCEISSELVSGDSESPLKAVPVNGSPSSSVQQDELKHDESFNFVSCKMDAEVAEENGEVLDQKNTEFSVEGSVQGCQIASEFVLGEFEILLQLVPETSSTRGDVHRDQQKDDESVNCLSSKMALGIVEDKKDSLAHNKIDLLKKVSPLQGYEKEVVFRDCEMSLEVATMTGSPRNCDQKGNISINCLSPKVVGEVLEEKDYTSTEESVDLCEKVSSLQGSEIPSKVKLVNGLLGNTVELKEHNSESDGIPTISDVSGWLKSDMRNKISFTQNGEMPIQASNVVEEVSNYGWKNDKRDNSGQHNQVSSACQQRFKIVHMPESPSSQVQQNEQMNNKSIQSAPVERFIESMQDKSNIFDDVEVETMTEMLPLEESSCKLTEGSLRVVTPKLEKLVSSQPCEPLDVVNDGSAKGLDVPHQSGKDISSINSSQAFDFSTQIYSDTKDGLRYDSAPETQCCGMVSLSSQRSSRRGKSNRKTQTKKEARKCRNTAKVSCTDEGVDNVLNASRKKRTCPSKQARSSIWGTLGNVSELFKQSNGHEVIQVQSEGSRKQKSSQKNGKKHRSGAAPIAQGSQRKCHSATNSLCLKVKVGKEVSQSCFNIHEAIDLSALAASAKREYETDMCLENNLGSPQGANGVVDKLRKCETGDLFECFGNDKEKKTYTDLVSDKLAGGMRDIFPGIPSHIGVEAPDPGTSPDSEVINLAPDTHDDFKPHQDLCDRALTTFSDVAASADLTGSKKAKKKSKLSGTDNCILQSQSPNLVRKNKAKSSNLHGQRQNSRDGLNNIETLASFISLKTSCNSSRDKEQSKDSLCFLGETEFAVSVETCNGDSGTEAKVESNPASHNSKDFLPDAIVKGHKIPKGKSQVCDPGNKKATERKQREAQKKSGNKKKTHGKAGCDKNACKLEIQPETGNNTVDGNGKTNSGEHVGHIDILNLDVKPGGISRSAWVRCDDCHKWRRITAELADYIEEIKCSWMCKDNLDKTFADCGIPQEKSNADINLELEISDASGEEDASGPRSKHKGLEHRRSTVSQQTVIHIKSNQFLHRSRKTQTIDEIMVCHCKPPSDGKLGCGDDCLNRMLNIECVRGACPCGALCSNQQFQKRRYAKLEPFRCGKKGCGLKSLEDISEGHFLIEYVGEVLDLHAYEARQKEYALKGHKHFYFMTLNCSEVIDACVKGNLGRFINHSCDPNCRTEKWMVNGEICIGLFALRDIKKGEEVTFDYNYVRVFGAAAKKCYCGSHRCRGCIGGDPLNSEVVVQSDSDEDHPEPVLIHEGGKIEDMNVMPRTSSSVVMHSVDSVLENRDEKDKSTIADGQLGVATMKVNSSNQSLSATSPVQKTSDFEDFVGNLTPIQFQETSRQTEDVVTTLTSVVGQDISVEEGTSEKASSSIQVLEISPPSKMLISTSSAEGVNGNKKYTSDTTDKRISSKSHPRVKTSRSSSSVKKKKVKSNPRGPIKIGMATNKASGLSSKPKKFMDGFSHVHFEAVEENLNDLLDADGGISKRNDAPKGYLKLLVLTAAASGDSSNGAIQSNRDLSMILDALLKTKSRMVLTDIINKNGLRMLHKMLKQYRTDFKKRPILRKLLKVLEYLATREILTVEHITGGPPCPGMESFRFSILSLTDHEDKQVHQIARNFRDRWIPRSFRRPSCTDRNNRKSKFHRNSSCNRSPMNNNWHDQDGRPMEAIDCIKQSMPATTLRHVSAQESCSAPSTGDSSTSGKTRKRKSRWDQPADPIPNSITLQSKEQKLDSEPLKQLEFSPLPGVCEVEVQCLGKGSTEDKNCAGYVHDHCLHNEVNVAHDGRRNSLVDVPPGFSSSLPNSLISSVASSTFFLSECPFDKVIVGYPQEKFVSRLPVSYGIPLSIIEPFGTPNAETLGSCIVPGMPFHPFPPLPAFPRDQRDPSPSLAVSHVPGYQTSEGHHDSRPLSDESTLSTTGEQRDTDTPTTSNQYTSKREREFSNDLGTRYFKQQKLNNVRPIPLQPWKRNGQPCMDSSRDGTSCMGIGTLTTEPRSTYSEDINHRLEKACNSSFQQSEHHNQH